MQKNQTDHFSLLHIENNSADTLICKKAFAKDKNFFAHYEVAQTFIEAAQLVKYDPDIVLLDLYLPDSSGIESVIKSQSLFPHAKHIVLLGSCTEDRNRIKERFPDIAIVSKDILSPKKISENIKSSIMLDTTTL